MYFEHFSPFFQKLGITEYCAKRFETNAGCKKSCGKNDKILRMFSIFYGGTGKITLHLRGNMVQKRGTKSSEKIKIHNFPSKTFLHSAANERTWKYVFSLRCKIILLHHPLDRTPIVKYMFMISLFSVSEATNRLGLSCCTIIPET